MNKQEIFTKAYEGVLKQGTKCVVICGTKGQICIYRDTKGNRCAIGHAMVGVIPEEHQFWESVDCLDRVCSLAKLDSILVPFLTLIQQAHDRCVDIEDFKASMQRIARIEGLDEVY